MSDSKQPNLEHNDGLGDLLKERESLEFSWIKTLAVIGVLCFGIFAAIYVIVSTGKDTLQHHTYDSPPPYTAAEQTPPTGTVINREPGMPLLTASPSPSAPKKSKKPTTLTPPKHSNVAPATASGTRTYRVIAGSFTKKQNALAQRDRLKKAGYSPFIRIANTNNGRVYRLQLAAFI